MKSTCLVSWSFAFGSLLAIVAVGCENVDPVDYQAAPLNTDAGAPDSEAPSYVASCRACIAAKCQSDYDACVNGPEPRCKPMVDCMIDTNCLAQLDLTDPTKTAECGPMCIKSAGLSSANEAQAVMGLVGLCLVLPTNCFHECSGK